MKKKPTPWEYKDAEGREVFPDSFGEKKMEKWGLWFYGDKVNSRVGSGYTTLK